MTYEHTTRTIRICLETEEDVICASYLPEHHFVPREGDLFRIDVANYHYNEREEELRDRTFVVKNVILEYVLRGVAEIGMYRATVIIGDKD